MRDVTAAQARRWIESFEASAAEDRRHRSEKGPRPEWSIRLAMSLRAAARMAGGGRLPADPLRAGREEAVRATWARLRAKLLG